MVLLAPDPEHLLLMLEPDHVPVRKVVKTQNEVPSVLPLVVYLVEDFACLRPAFHVLYGVYGDVTQAP